MGLGRDFKKAGGAVKRAAKTVGKDVKTAGRDAKAAAKKAGKVIVGPVAPSAKELNH